MQARSNQFHSLTTTTITIAATMLSRRIFIIFVVSLSSSLFHCAPSIPAEAASIDRSRNVSNTEVVEYDLNRFLSFFDYFDVASTREGRASWLTCQFCSTALSMINLYPSVSTVQTIFARGCSTLRYEEASVCEGLARLFGDEFVFIVTHSKLSYSEMCGLFIGPKCMDRSQLEDEKWILPLLPVKAFDLSKFGSQAKLPENSTSNILQVSDIHLDQYYEPKSMTYCQEPLCCRAKSGATGISKPAGYWGSMGNCDLVLRTVEAMISNIANQHAHDYRYMIFTGDYIAHDVWNTTKEEIIRTTSVLNNLFRQNVPKDKIVIPVIGNHEGYPVDQFCPPSLNLKEFSSEWLYAELLKQWNDWIPSAYHNTFLKNGYYARVDNSVRFIVLNMNNCARMNFWLAYDYLDLGGMLTWLQEELQQAVSNKQYVYIVGHIAPDESECVSHWVRNYLAILEHYAPIIKGQLFGHTHFDELRLYYSASNHFTPMSMAYLAPSATTFNDVNPSFRIYQTHAPTADIIDHVTYYLNITKANVEYQTHLSRFSAPIKPQFEREYSARQAYNLSDLSSQTWHNFAVSLRTNDTMLKRFYKHYGRYSEAQVDKTSVSTMKSVVDGLFVH